MAEPMDVDSSVCEFDNKENSCHLNNVLSRTPCTEKGYEELDVSELNMKLRYSITPASTPMSKSYTADNGNYDNENTNDGENGNMSRSLHSTITKNDTLTKLQKSLQNVPSEQTVDTSRSILGPLDATVTIDKSVSITVTGPNDIDDVVSMPSSTSSMAHTPEATTPTRDIPKMDEASPIIRGLKSVLSMFRPSQSPIPLTDDDDVAKQEALSPPIVNSPDTSGKNEAVLASTPLTGLKTKDPLAKRGSANTDSLVFNEDLEKEIQWKDDSTVIFSTEKIPIHKLFYQQKSLESKGIANKTNENTFHDNKTQSVKENLDSTVEYMDISYNDTSTIDNTLSKIQVDVIESEVLSDSEFVDCETTLNKNESYLETSFKSVTQGNELLTKDMDDVNGNVPDTDDDFNTTLNGSDFKSENISNASTTKITNISSEILPEVLVNDEAIQEIVPETQRSLPSGELSNTRLKANVANADISSENDNNTQTNMTMQSVENVGVHIISQIPLFADPRVLLFNVQESADKVNTETTLSASVASLTPADVPLPDDDEIEKSSNVVLNVSSQEKCSTDLEISVAQKCDENNFTFPVEVHPSHPIVNTDISSTNVSEGIDGLISVDVSSYLGNTLSDRSEIPYASSFRENMVTLPNIVEGEPPIKNNIAIDSVPLTNIPLTEDIKTIDPTNSCEKPETNPMNNISHIDFIRQEVDTIVIKAVDIVNNKLINSDNINNESKLNDVMPMEHDTEVKSDHFITSLDSSVKDVNIINETSKQDTSYEIQGIDFGVGIVQTETYNKVKLASNETLKQESDLTTLGNNHETINEQMPLSLVTNNCNETNHEIKQKYDESVNCESDYNVTTKNSELVTEQLSTSLVIGSLSPKERLISDDQILSSDRHCLEKDTAIEETQQPCLPIDSTVNVESDVRMETNEIRECKDSSAISSELNITPKDIEKIDKMETDDELVVSADNSPFVILSNNIADEVIEDDKFDIIESPVIASSPPGSPKIVSKGYNFNFDEMDDPFATKTKIRMSPPPTVSGNQTFEAIATEKQVPEFNKNMRRKSQPTRKPVGNSKKLNSTISKINVDKKSPKDKKLLPVKAEDKQDIDIFETTSRSNEVTGNDVEKATTLDDHNATKIEKEITTARKLTDKSLSEVKETSSSDQSVYCSAAASLTGSSDYKSLPNTNFEDDNFNPFTTNTKIRQSPPPNIDNPFATESKINNSPDRSVMTVNDAPVDGSNDEPTASNKLEETHLKTEENDSVKNISDTTTSPKTSDESSRKDVHTEDEDTIEGPFLETEELDYDDKIFEFNGDNNDMMQFTETLPVNDENTDAGEMFIDAEAFEFLLNQNKTNINTDNGKESLFLKFDPLFAKRLSSDGVLSALHKVQKRQSTPKKITPIHKDETFNQSPVAGPSKSNAIQDIDISNDTEESLDDLNVTVSKPMMVVNPAVNPVVTPRNKTMTPIRSNRQSLTFTSPAIAVIDRLLSMSANNSTVLADATINEGHRDSEADLALTQLRELLADKEISVYTLRSETKELRERLATVETQMSSLEATSEERLKKINELNEKLDEKSKLNKSMAKVVEGYERTIASLIAETEHDKKRHAEERIQLMNERDEQAAHLASMEVSFNDLHSKYEKSKQVILGFKANEDACKKSIKEFDENLAKMQSNYELLKQHATSKLNHANEELQKINRTHEAEVLKLNALLKRKELHITSLEETLQQKTKANEELTAICDELINKVG